MKIGSLFSGYGGLDLAVAEVTGASPAWHAEVDKHAAAILDARFPDVPNLGDITAVDWATVEPVDIITGGFPCQDVSHAGNRAGIKPGTRSGLWSHMAYIVKTLRPRLVVIENVSGLLSADAAGDVEPCPWCLGDQPGGHLRALGAVLADLAEIGFDEAEWASVRASDAGGCHRRERVFIVAADAGGERRDWSRASGPGRGTKPANDGDEPVAGRFELADQIVALLPTPAARDGKDPNPNQRNGEADLPTAVTDFGPYAAAIARWAAVIGRPAPPPTEPGSNGRPRLSPAFVEWMMGLPAGWVTDTGIPRNAQLKALGNGVVPQQAALALAVLLPRLDIP